MAYFNNSGSNKLKVKYNEDIYETREVKYLCFAYDTDGNNEIDYNDDELYNYCHFYIKDTGVDDLSKLSRDELKKILFSAGQSGFINNTEQISFDSLINIGFFEEDFDLDNGVDYILESISNDKIVGKYPGWDYDNNCYSDELFTDQLIRYPEGDFVEGTEKVFVETVEKTEKVNEVLSTFSIPDNENKEYIAPEGKAWKKVDTTKFNNSFFIVDWSRRGANINQTVESISEKTKKGYFYIVSFYTDNPRVNYKVYFIGDGIKTFKESIFNEEMNTLQYFDKNKMRQVRVNDYYSIEKDAYGKFCQIDVLQS